MRSATGKAILLGVALATASFVGCSSKDKSPSVMTDDPTSGTVGLELVLAPGVIVNSVGYQITGPGGFTRSGSVDVTNSSTISFGVGALPAGTGYTITLTTSANDGGVNCVGSGTFDVIARSTTTVNVALTCQRPRNNGTILVNGTVNICPVIDSFASTNAQNGVIQLSSAASDLDSAPSPLAYLWTVLSGPATLASPASANTALNCTGNGAVSLRLDVTDGDSTMNCPDRVTTSVNCSGVVANDGGAGAGAGGAGGAGGAAAGAGGSAAGAGGSAAGAGGSAAGAGGSAAGAGGSGPPPVTTDSILAAKSADCRACAAAIDLDVFGCNSTAQNCEKFTDGRKQLCLDTLSCVIPSSCVEEASSNLAPCYCGTALGADCLTASLINGVCKSQIELGLGSTNPTFIAGNTTNQMLGAGMAMSLTQCLADGGCMSCF